VCRAAPPPVGSAIAQALYNTSIFRPVGEAVPKHQVVRDYLGECVKWQTHHKNTKYVIGEMMNNRRAPSSRKIHLPQVYPGGQTMGRLCACHSIADLCKLWDVRMTEDRWTRLLDARPRPTTEHRYDDAYFLAPKGGEGVQPPGTAERAPTVSSKRQRIEGAADDR